MSDAEVSAEEGSVLSEYLISFVSFLTRMTIKLGITIGLIASVVITFYHLGQLGKDAIKERKCYQNNGLPRAA
ncbi:unnamed protein product [Anisakis simplex]|uniref:Amino acid transporter n=1 Tax=Anisakis simplex TaxID=6269 RepID=A0A0M3JPA4_ANISI|nr:unnamed protein product [Anisakis simplex]